MPVDDVELGQLGAVILDRLRDVLGDPGLTYRRPPAPLGGGRFSSVFTLEVAPVQQGWGSAFVVRLVGSSYQVHLEAGLHSAANTQGELAPRVLVWEPSATELGGGFVVMERLPGATYLRGVEPWRFALDLPKIATAWPRQLAKVLAALARVDIDEARRALERHDVPELLRGPGAHLQTVSTSLEGEPELANVLEWLHEHRPPPPERLALVHGDLWPGNVFIDGDDIRLIDWTRGGIDDPALDVGFAKVGFSLMPEPFPPPPPIRELVRLTGRSIARRVAQRCEPLVGGSERVRYYEALRCAAELAEVVTNRTTGRPAGWEHGVPALVRHLEATTGRSIHFA